MKEGTPIRVTHQPFHEPSATPTASATGTATSGSISHLTVHQATTTPTRATAEPTEMSKLRVTMSMTALMAASPVMADCSDISVRLRWLRKMPSVSHASTTHVTMSTAMSE